VDALMGYRLLAVAADSVDTSIAVRSSLVLSEPCWLWISGCLTEQPEARLDVF